MSDPTPTEASPRSGRIDRALILSVVAIVISLAGTGVAAYEANLTRRQQDIVLEQRAASAWPHIEALPRTDWGDDTTHTYTLVNKGLGPAILGDVRYLLDTIETESFAYDGAIAAAANGFRVNVTSNQQVDSAVLAPGERVTVVELYVNRRGAAEDTFRAVRDAMRLDFCYCSVYGRCWRFDGSRQPRRSPECEADFAAR